MVHPERTLKYGRGLPAGGFCSLRQIFRAQDIHISDKNVGE